MTYSVGIMLDTGLIFASDSRTHAEVDNFACVCKMTVFERAGDRVIVLLSSGNLAGTQAVISLLQQRGARDGVDNLWRAESTRFHRYKQQQSSGRCNFTKGGRVEVFRGAQEYGATRWLRRAAGAESGTKPGSRFPG